MKQLGVKIDIGIMYAAIGSSEFDADNFFIEIPDGVDAHSTLNSIVPSAVEDMCTNGVPIKRGLMELLKTLRENKIEMAVATSTPISISGRLLKAAGVYDEFSFITTRAEVERGKPFPDIFLKACETAGVAPENALVIEDSNNGGRAAAAAGIKYIIVPDVNEPAPDVASGALAVVDSLLDVPKILGLSTENN